MPAEAIFNPPAPASVASLLRSSTTCARASIDRIANLGAELDHRLVHLGFDLLLEHHLAAFENLLNVRTQLARLRIDDGKFLLDPERVSVWFVAVMAGRNSALKNELLSSEAGEACRVTELASLPLNR